MSNIIKMLMSAVITTAVFVGYKVIILKRKKNRCLDKQTSEKVKNISCCDDEEYPTLHNPHWKKSGDVSNLMIYPVKSSQIPLFYTSCELRDFGMCIQKFQTHFWDGMFLLYNKTKGKFEDSRRYPLLKLLQSYFTNTGKVKFIKKDLLKVDILKIEEIDQHFLPSNRFVTEIWNRTFETFYGSDLQINTWLKDSIDVKKTNEDLIFALKSPHNLDSTEEIKNNWFRFLEGYENMEKDETGKFVTLPHFVLMTQQTCEVLTAKGKTSTPNIIVKTDDESIKPFEEKNWDWVKLGNDVTLRRVKPVPSFDKEIQHYGIYYALWSGGNVKIGDEVYIYYP